MESATVSPIQFTPPDATVCESLNTFRIIILFTPTQLVLVVRVRIILFPRSDLMIVRCDLYGAISPHLCESTVKPAFHDADTDADILADIVARMSACRSACLRNNFRKSRLSDVSARFLSLIHI